MSVGGASRPGGRAAGARGAGAARWRSFFTELFRLSSGRPAISAGLRAGAAAALPLFASPVVPLDLISFVSQGAYSATMVDKGGAYRDRFWRMATIATIGAFGAALGNYFGDHPIFGLPLVSLWLGCCALTHAGGRKVAGVGIHLAILFLTAWARPSSTLQGAALAGLSVCTGAIQAMVLALFLWPVRVYRPARAAVATAYERLGALARSIAEKRDDSEEAVRICLGRRAQLRDAVEEAREVLSATRRGRQAEGERGSRLLALIENCDQLLGVLIAIDGWLEGRSAHARGGVPEALATLERACAAIASMVRSDRLAPLQVERIAVPEGAEPAPLLLRLRRHADGAAEAAEALREGRRGTLPPPFLLQAEAEPSLWKRFVDALDRRSLVLRHAVRVAIAGTVAAEATTLLETQQGYWITIAAVTILQPLASDTFRRVFERMIGAVFGAAIAVAALASIHDRFTFAALVFLLCSTSVAILPINFSLFSVLLTPAFVLLAELGHRGEQLAWVRIVDTAIGAGIAFGASRLLWPSWERARFPDLLEKALRESARWIRSLSEKGPDTEGSERARRTVGIALVNAESSLQRLLSELPSPVTVEALMALLLYLRRLHGTSLAFFSQAQLDRSFGREAGEATASFLEGIARCVAEGRPPGPEEAPAPVDALLERRGYDPLLAMIARQLAILHTSAMRALEQGDLHPIARTATSS